jgi:transposase
MKFLQTLSSIEIDKITSLYKNDLTHRVRQRSHIILMKNKKFSINDISKIVDLDRDTVSRVIDNWNSEGINWLYDNKRSGRPKFFSENEEKDIIKKIENNPKNLKNVTAEIIQETGKKSSVHTVKRVLKRNNKVWKRMKRALAKKPDEALFNKAYNDLDMLKKKFKKWNKFTLFWWVWIFSNSINTICLAKYRRENGD